MEIQAPTEPSTAAPTPAAPVSTTGEVSLDDASGFVLNYELFENDIVFTMTFNGEQRPILSVIT